MTQPYLNVPPDLPTASRLLQRMDLRTMTQSLVTLAEDNMAFFSSQGPGETARRLTGVFAGIREQALGLEPALGRLLSVAHLFDLDPETPVPAYNKHLENTSCMPGIAWMVERGYKKRFYTAFLAWLIRVDLQIHS